MTINERVSPETLDKIIEAADDFITALAVTTEDDSTNMRQLLDGVKALNATPEIVKQMCEIFKAMARELQQYRAAAEPVYQYQAFTFVENSDGEQEKFWFWSDCDERFYTACKGTKRILYAAPQVTSVPQLAVWYGSMPETNGKINWTAILHRKGQHPWEGITIDLSEYPDRVRYEADRMRHLIGELADEPDILAYDADAHSGYVKTGNSPAIPDGWIPVSERMPEFNDEVLVWHCHGFPILAVYGACKDPKTYKTYRCLRNNDGEIDATHWMPLPAAPKQEAE